MTRVLMMLSLLTLPIAGCQTADQNAAAGALGGAALGAAVSSKGDKLTGALVGAAVGVAASTLIGPAPTKGQCYYRDAYNNRYVAPCR